MRRRGDFIVFSPLRTWQNFPERMLLILRFLILHTIRHMYHFTRYICAMCSRSLDKVPQSISRSGKTVSTFDKAEIYASAVFFVVDDIPAPSVARNDSDAFAQHSTPMMMILNNDEKEARDKNVQNFFNKNYWLQRQRNSLWCWGLFVDGGSWNYSNYSALLIS